MWAGAGAEGRRESNRILNNFIESQKIGKRYFCFLECKCFSITNQTLCIQISSKTFPWPNQGSAYTQVFPPNKNLSTCPAPRRKLPYTSFSGGWGLFFSVSFELRNKRMDDLHSKKAIANTSKTFIYTQVPTPLWLISFKRFFFGLGKKTGPPLGYYFFGGFFGVELN